MPQRGLSIGRALHSLSHYCKSCYLERLEPISSMVQPLVTRISVSTRYPWHLELSFQVQIGSFVKLCNESAENFALSVIHHANMC